MDRRERFTDDEETMRMLFESEQAGLWTALPGYVVSYNPAAMTCSIQTTIQCRVRAPDGTMTFETITPLVDCPVIFPSGGGYTLTMPLAPGDEGLVIFSSRCIDAWWQQGGVQVPPEIRMHDLSDGFFMPGVFSQPRVIKNLSTTTAQLRSNDGMTFVDVNGPGQIVTVTAPVGIVLNSPVVTVAGIINVQNENSVAVPCTINGAISATGEIKSTLGGTHTLTQHTHSDPQGGSTGLPTG